MRENPSKQRVRNRRGKTVFTLAARTLGNLGEFPSTGIDQGLGNMTALAWPDFLLVPPCLGRVTGTDRVKALASLKSSRARCSTWVCGVLPGLLPKEDATPRPENRDALLTEISKVSPWVHPLRL